MRIPVFSFLDKAKALTDFLYVMGIYFLQAYKIRDFIGGNAFGVGRFPGKSSYTIRENSFPNGILSTKTSSCLKKFDLISIILQFGPELLSLIKSWRTNWRRTKLFLSLRNRKIISISWHRKLSQGP